jgi:hypothetical protein
VTEAASKRGRRNRTKGAEFEREVAARLSEILGVIVKRKLGAARDGGDDIQVGPYSIECKRRKATAVDDWMRQAEENAAKTGRIPVVVTRADRREAIYCMRERDFVMLFQGELIGWKDPNESHERSD